MSQADRERVPSEGGSAAAEGAGNPQPGRLKRGALWSLRWMRRHPVWSLLCVVALAISWWLSPETYPVRITVELEYQGKPVVISRVNRCVAWIQGHGIGSGSSKFWRWRHQGMGTVLPDGSAVFMSTPNACPYISTDQWKTKRVKYGDETPQPAPTFVPDLAWAPDAKNIEGFEQYYLTEAVTSPGSRILYKGTKAERLRFYPFPVFDDGFGWFNAIDELTAYKKTADFLAFFLLPIPEAEWRKFDEVASYIEKESLTRDVVVLPFEVWIAMTPYFRELTTRNFFFSFADKKFIAESEFLLYGGGGSFPPIGMMKTGDYRGTTIRPKSSLEKIDEVIALRIEGDRLVEANTKGIQFRKKYEPFTSQKKTENKWTVERPDIRYPINFYSGVIYDRQRGQLYSFMTHKLQLCYPYTPCAMR